MSKQINAAGKVAGLRIAQKTARAVVLVPADLVTVERSQPVTTSERIAAAAGIQHKNVLAAVREHLGELQEYGQVAFQTRLNPQGSPTEYALLGFEQSTLLFTFLRNSPAVRAVKVRLVREFFRTSAELAKLKALHADPVWQVARTDAARGYKFMSRVTHELRIGSDKPATTNTHIAEAGVIAFAMTGDSMDRPVRDKLPPEELRLLDHVQFENGILIARGLSRPDRKNILRGVVLQERADHAIKIGAQA